MEDYLEILIFLAFAVFSLLSRFLSPKKKPPVRNPREQPQYDLDDIPQSEKPVVARERTEPKPVSFEDVLRELMGESPRPRSTPPPLRPAEPIEKAREKVSEARAEVRKVTQPIKKATRIADKVSLEDTGKRMKPIELSEQKRSLAQEVSEALKSPENAREAVILSEIINRKYF